MIPATLVCSFALLLSTACAAAEAPFEPVTLLASSGAHEPQVAVRGDTVAAVYATKTAIEICLSRDRAQTFSPPVRIAEPGAIALGMRRGPRVAFAGDALVVTAIAGEKGGGKDENLFAWRSIDMGASWQGPVRINEVEGSAREGLHALAAGPKGELFCAWVDLRDDKGVLYGAASGDQGVTWGAPRVVYRSPEGSICECCHPSLAFDTEGHLYAMWCNQLDGARDLYVAKSEDGGKTFSAARKVSQGTWKIDGCPMDGGAIAAVTPTYVVCLQRREKTLYLNYVVACPSGLDSSAREIDDAQNGFSGCTDYAYFPPAEHEFAQGVQPALAHGKDGIYFLWSEGRGRPLRVTRPPSTDPIELDPAAIYGALASPIDGDGPVIATWETTDGQIRVARVDM